MTPQHMEAMCMRITAVVEDMPSVQHEPSGLVHGVRRMSRAPGRNDPSVSAKKIRSAVTDDEREIRFDREAKPGIANLLTIYSVLAGRSILQLEQQYEGHGYGDLKKDLAEVVVETFGPIRARALELLDDPAELDRVLAGNADRAAAIADVTLAKVYDRIGLLPRSRP